jgi:hypothetical protein
MHFAYKDADGELFYSFDKEDENMRVDYNINFYEEQLKSLNDQIQAMGAKLSKPPKDDNGVSDLRGVQLQVVLKKGYETSLLKLEDDYSDKLIYQITPQEVHEVKLVCSGETGYIEAPGYLRMSGDLAIQAVYKSAAQAPSKPQTLEEAKSAIANLTKAQSRGKNRQAAKAGRQAQRGAAAMQATKEEAKVTSSSANSKIVLTDDEDDDQPE